MNRTLLLFVFLTTSLFAFTQWGKNQTPTYPELIEYYHELAEKHDEIELYAMGESDYGLPIYLCVLNGAQDSLGTFLKAKTSTTILINNAIHPGEPDGVNACIQWIEDWINEGKKTKNMPVIGIIPIYNVGGAMNRSSNSRANQNGPEEYGFRGNAQNLDLNRDFIKMDSKNMFTFAKIYHGLDPDVFLDTHVSNGADYQYTMTYIASVRERMAPQLGDLMHDDLIPFLEKHSAKRGFNLIPYVHLRDETPESGIEVFNDLPRYAMGYASLMNAISFTLETHMLKPFPQRVESTLVFIDEVINWTSANQSEIEEARKQADEWERSLTYYRYNYRATDKKDSIWFKGFEFSHPVSKVTGEKRLKYHQDKPYEKYVPYFKTYAPNDSIVIPDYYLIGGQCTELIERLRANNVELVAVTSNPTLTLQQQRIVTFDSNKKPYEGHFMHSKAVKESNTSRVQPKPIDYFVPTQQKNRRFIISVLEPSAPDSYFVWNFFDSYVQQKEYFSPYVFEDKAKEILENDPELKYAFDQRKLADKDFASSTWAQLYFIYKHSEYFEPSFNALPVYEGTNKTR